MSPAGSKGERDELSPERFSIRVYLCSSVAIMSSSAVRPARYGSWTISLASRLAAPRPGGMIEDERVGPAFPADGRRRPVAREEQGGVGQVQELREDARHELRVVAPQVGPADRAGEEDVPAEDEARVELLA